jgi:hypothetical protein
MYDDFSRHFRKEQRIAFCTRWKHEFRRYSKQYLIESNGIVQDGKIIVDIKRDAYVNESVPKFPGKC